MPDALLLAAIHDLLPPTGSRVLLLGDGAEGIAEGLRDGHKTRVTGLDDDLSGASFDVVVLVGVLDLVDDPQQVLRRLVSAGSLAAPCNVIASVANASHHRRLGALLVGDPVLDGRSRPFTLPALEQTLENAGFLLDRVVRVPGVAEPSTDALGRLIGDLNAESDVASYVVRAVPDGASARLAQDRQAWAEERDDLRRQLELASRNLESVSNLLTAERATFAEAVARGAKELELRNRRVAQLRGRRDTLVAQRDAARRKLRRYRSSRSVRLTLRVVEKVRRLRGRP